MALFLTPASAQAFTVKAGQSINFNKGETIEGSYYTAGNNITIDGLVKGDVICAGQSININGEVQGDVICAGQSININGKVDGNVRVLSNVVNVNGQIGKNLMLGAATLNTSASSTIGGEALIGAAVADLHGRINGDLSAAGANINLAGTVVKNVLLRLDNKNSKNSNLVILDSGYVGGNLTYTSANDATISGKARVVGKIDHKLPSVRNVNPAGEAAGWLLGRIYSIFAAIIIGLVLIGLWGKQLKVLTDQMLKRIGPSIGWGAVILIITPVICLLLLITLIGIPLAILMGLIYIIMLWLSKILVGILVGRTILARWWKPKQENLLIALSIGVLICWLLFSIPFIGWLFALAAMLWGLGGLFLYFKQQ